MALWGKWLAWGLTFCECRLREEGGERQAMEVATHILALPPTRAISPIQEVLLQPIADARPKLGARTSKHAAAAVAGIGIVPSCVAPHDSLALQVPTRALPARAAKPIATALAIRIRLVRRTVRRAPRARLLRIADPRRRSTHRLRGRKLAAPAAVLIRIITYSPSAELTRRRLAARIIAAPFRAAAIALLAFLDDAVAAHLPADGRDVAVVGEAVALDAVAAEGAADVADRAWGEARNAAGRRRVHDVLRAGVAGAGGERAALLRRDGVGGAAGVGGAVVHGAEGVAGFVAVDRG